MGGAGDDHLVDSSTVGWRWATVFYDAHGTNTFVTAGSTASTRSRTSHYQPKKRRSRRRGRALSSRGARLAGCARNGAAASRTAEPPGPAFLREKLLGGRRTWGSNRASHRPSTSSTDRCLLGLNRTSTLYGFRHDPYNTRVSLGVEVGPESGRFGATLDAVVRPENSRISYTLGAHATQLEVSRFPGFGNDTEQLDSDLALVHRDEVLVRPAVRMGFGGGNWIEAGPCFATSTPTRSTAVCLRPARPRRTLRAGRRQWR